MAKSFGRVQLTPQVLSSLAIAQVHREHTKNILSLDFDSTGRYCLSVGEDEALNVYDCESGKHMKTSNSKKYGVDLARFVNKSHNNVIYASTKGDDALRLMSLHDNKYIRYFKGHTSRVVSLDISPSNDLVLSASKFDGVRLWDLRSPNCQGMMKLDARRCVVAFDPQGVIFAVGINSESIRLFDPTNFDKGPFAVFDGLKDSEYPTINWTALAFSADGVNILISTDQDVLFIADAFKQAPLRVLRGLSNVERIRLMAVFTPDAQSVICGSGDGTVHIWSVATGNTITILKGHPSACSVVKFNSHYAMMASAHAELAFWLPSDENGPMFGDEFDGSQK